MIESILNDTEIAGSGFEYSSFSFIREWLTGAKKYELHTSGSTGEPKTIHVTREQMERSAKLTEQALQLTARHHALVAIDTKHVGGRMMIVRCLTSGMRMSLVDPCANPLTKIPVDRCVNFAAFVPFQIHSILESKHPHLLNNLDLIIVGGAPLNEKLIQRLEPFICRCYATYGMTETLSHIALRKLNGSDKTQHFELLPDIQATSDNRGCLVAHVPYLKEPLYTNDLVAFVTPNRFTWLGRWDNVINTGGIKVSPEKIEAATEEIFLKAGIENKFFIHGVEDERLGQKVVLFIEADNHASVVLSKLLTDLSQALPPFETPVEIHVLNSFATTPTGKIDRNKTLRSQVVEIITRK